MTRMRYILKKSVALFQTTRFFSRRQGSSRSYHNGFNSQESIFLPYLTTTKNIRFLTNATKEPLQSELEPLLNELRDRTNSKERCSQLILDIENLLGTNKLPVDILALVLNNYISSKNYSEGWDFWQKSVVVAGVQPDVQLLRSGILLTKYLKMMPQMFDLMTELKELAPIAETTRRRSQPSNVFRPQSRSFQPIEVNLPLEDCVEATSNVPNAIKIRKVTIVGDSVRAFELEYSHPMLCTYLLDPNKLIKVNVSAPFGMSVVTRGLSINGQVYSFLGSTNASNKRKWTDYNSRDCYFYKGTDLEIWEKVLPQLVDPAQFDDQGIGPFAKRASLFYTGLKGAIPVFDSEVFEIDDITSKDGKYIFTEGCGFISSLLAEELASAAELSEVPSIMQIRYKGCKGVVAVLPTLTNRKLYIRKSMIKIESCPTKKIETVYMSPNILFKGDGSWTFLGLVGSSNEIRHRPVLSPNVVEVLLSRGVAKESLLKECNSANTISSICHLMKLFLINKQIEASYYIIDYLSGKDLPDNLKTFMRKTQCRSSNNSKCIISSSMSLYGIPEPIFGDQKPLLAPGQCIVKLSHDYFRECLTGKVSIFKDPVYISADVRNFEAVKVDDERFIDYPDNCIIFSVTDAVPPCKTLSDSDYDGDRYSLIFNENILPVDIEKITDYVDLLPAKKAAEEPVTYRNLIQNWYEPLDFKTGVVHNLFQRFANNSDFGIDSEVCKSLHRIFHYSLTSELDPESKGLINKLKAMHTPLTLHNQSEGKKFYDELKNPVFDNESTNLLDLLQSESNSKRLGQIYAEMIADEEFQYLCPENMMSYLKELISKNESLPKI